MSNFAVTPHINVQNDIGFGKTVTFRYNGTGTNVYLAGSFNNWSTSATPMTKSGNVFSTTVTLAEGATIGVVVSAADGEKCDRCWNYTTTPFHDEDGCLCPRCRAVLGK